MNRRQLKMDLRREKDNNLYLGVGKYHKLLTNQMITNLNKNKLKRIYKHKRQQTNSKISKEQETNQHPNKNQNIFKS